MSEERSMKVWAFIRSGLAHIFDSPKAATDAATEGEEVRETTLHWEDA